VPRLLPSRFRTECIRELELASSARHTEARHLAEAGRRTAAIYLFGYVVEMTLKVAFLRLAGHGDEQEITPTILRSYAGTSPTSTARTLGLPGTTNLHDLASWADLIVAYRADRRLLYSTPELRTMVVANTRIVHERWVETIRYHANVAYQHELVRVQQACGWILEHKAVI
jgi:hypothetical protein